MDEQFWQRLEDTLDRKLEEKLEEKLDKKLDEKLNKKLERKLEENNNKLIQYIDKKINEEHQKTVSDVSRELGRIVDVVGEQIQDVKEKQKCIIQELRATRKEVSARLELHDYRLEKLEEKVV